MSIVADRLGDAPQWQAGLELMRQLGRDLGLEVDVHGPTESMTGICKLAIDWVRQDD